MEKIYTPKQNYKVLVRCFTYNQSKYIEDALNGFAMQQTNFPFVCLVMDDCSTDGEQEVLKSWMTCECDMEKAEYIEIELSKIILVPHKSKANCTFAFYLLKQNLYGTGKKMPLVTPWREHCEYEALCEGDDYWISPLKLQKQADYLDSHPECGIVGSTKRSYIQQDGKFVEDPKTESHTDFETALLKGRFNCGTCTIMYRIKALDGYNEFVADEQKKKKWRLGDLPQWLYIMVKHTAYRFEEPMAVYRVLPESASHSSTYDQAIAFRESVCEIQTFFATEYRPDLLKKVERNRNRRLFHTAIEYKKKKDALKYAKLSSLSFTDYLRFVRFLINK